jgi:hypothetical protein
MPYRAFQPCTQWRRLQIEREAGQLVSQFISLVFGYSTSPNLPPPLPNLLDKNIRHLPSRKMPTSFRLVPIHYILVITLAPLPRCITIVATKPTDTNRNINRPSSRIRLVLPVITSRRCARVGEPVQHDRVEHLVFREHRLYIAIVMRPVFVLLIHPSSLRDWRVREPVA